MHDFLFSSDTRNFVFVMNQLRRILGNREPISKKIFRSKEKSIRTKEKKKRIFDRLQRHKEAVVKNSQIELRMEEESPVAH